jgi:hypothetical protein
MVKNSVKSVKAPGKRTFKALTAAQLVVAKITRGENGTFAADGDEDQRAVTKVLLVPFAEAFNDPPEGAKMFGHKWLKDRKSLALQLDALELDAANSMDVIDAFVDKFNSFRKSDLRKLKKDTHEAEQAGVPKGQRQTYRASEAEAFEKRHGKTEAKRKEEIAASLGMTASERTEESCQATHSMSRSEFSEKNCQAAHSMSCSELTEQNCQATHEMSRSELGEQNCQAAHGMSRSEFNRTAATRKFFALAREMAALPPLAPRSALRAAPASSAATKYCPKPVSRRRAAKRDSHYADLRTKLGPPPTRVRFLY